VREPSFLMKTLEATSELHLRTNRRPQEAPLGKKSEIAEPQPIHAPIEAPLRRRVTGGFIVAVLMTVFIGFSSWRYARLAAEDADWVVHTYSVMDALELTAKHVIEMETSARTFALTGQDSFLASYEAARGTVAQEEDALRHLTADNPNQQRRLDLLEPQIGAALKFAASLVAKRQLLEAIPSDSEILETERLIDAARATSQEMKADEMHLLSLRTQKTNAGRRLTSFIIVGGILVGAALLAFARLAVNREIDVSTGARAQISTMNAELEQRVEQRTSLLQSEIAERKRTEAALQQSEETLRLLLDGVKDHAIFMLDPEGRVVSWTSCATRLLGYQSNEIIGQHVSCLYSSADSESGKPGLELERAILNGRNEEIGQRKRKDGTLFWAEAMESPLFNDSGALRGFAKVVRDITERKQTEHVLVLQAEHLARTSRALQVLNDELELRVSQRTTQLESSNQELEAFTYSVSHDLRAPLRHISGFSKLLVEDFGERLQPEAKQYLERIVHGVRRMGILVDELLALAGVGRHKLNVGYADVNSLVNEVVTILTPETEGRLVEWQIGDLGFATCDAVLLAQVFQNLIGNALKFTRSRATAVIEIGRIEDAGQLTFFVRDNGVGFDMKYADKLFGVFQRLHRIEDFEGTGIGLATVRRIVQKHAGRTWAEAELGKGATFYFTMALPAEVQAEMRSTGEEVQL